MTTIYTPLPFHHEWHVTSLENSENLQLKSHVITARLHIHTYVLLVLLLWLLALLGKPKLLKQFTFENKAVKKSPCLQNQLE